MAAPQQIGPSVALAANPVFYVPPPDQPPNVFASFWSGFMQTRTPWATDLFKARLAALDPRAKAEFLTRLAKIDADRLAQQEATRRVFAQKEQDYLKQIVEILKSDNLLKGTETRSFVDLGIARGKAEQARFAAQQVDPRKTQPIIDQLTSDLSSVQANLQRELTGANRPEVVNGLVQEAEGARSRAVQAMDAAGLDQVQRSLVGQAIFTDLERGPLSQSRAPGADLAVRALQRAAGAVEGGPPPAEPTFRGGAPGERGPVAQFAQQEFQRLTEGGAPTTTETRAEVSRRGAAPTGAAPAGVQAPSFPGAAPSTQTVFAQPGQAPARAPARTGTDLIREQIEREFAQPAIGGVFDPLPGPARRAPRNLRRILSGLDLGAPAAPVAAPGRVERGPGAEVEGAEVEAAEEEAFVPRAEPEQPELIDFDEPVAGEEEEEFVIEGRPPRETRKERQQARVEDILDVQGPLDLSDEELRTLTSGGRRRVRGRPQELQPRREGRLESVQAALEEARRTLGQEIPESEEASITPFREARARVKGEEARILQEEEESETAGREARVEERAVKARQEIARGDETSPPGVTAEEAERPEEEDFVGPPAPTKGRGRRGPRGRGRDGADVPTRALSKRAEKALAEEDFVPPTLAETLGPTGRVPEPGEPPPGFTVDPEDPDVFVDEAGRKFRRLAPREPGERPRGPTRKIGGQTFRPLE